VFPWTRQQGARDTAADRTDNRRRPDLPIAVDRIVELVQADEDARRESGAGADNCPDHAFRIPALARRGLAVPTVRCDRHLKKNQPTQNDTRELSHDFAFCW